MIGSVSEIFEAAAAKYLTAVDAASAQSSNQHEIGGLVKAGLGHLLGKSSEDHYYSALFAYIGDDDNFDQNTPIICTDVVNWYDSRRNRPNRSPEFRLYYPDNEVTHNINEGDLVIVAKMKDGRLALIFTPENSPAANQLKYLFGFVDLTTNMKPAKMPAGSLILPVRLLLEEIGINSFSEEDINNDLNLLLEKFPNGLPTTAVLSELARNLTGIDSRDGADEALIAWIEREELLFRAYEKHLVTKQLQIGFGQDGSDVDSFIKFSLSVHNRRKSRAGHAFENHLTEVFTQHGLSFERGKGKLYTEGTQQPDFMFPSFSAYHDPNFPENNLVLLGAKTTCKDRWRQVLAEGNRLDKKYLITLQGGITEQQTQQMRDKSLQLIVPREIKSTYSKNQKDWLYDVAQFIQVVKNKSI